MAATMRHAGDTRVEECFFDGAGLAVVRNPLPPGSALAASPDGARALALSGHVVGGIANDAAGLLAEFAEHGEGLPGALNGVFALAHYDTASQTLTIASDRYGFMPLYYYHDRERLIFASEVKAIVRAIGRPEFDWEAVADFFYIGHMTGEKTLFKGIKALRAAEILTCAGGSPTSRTYHDFTRTPVLPAADVRPETVAALFTQAVERRVRADLPNTLLLSGGFDSRLILGALHQLGVAPELIVLEHREGPSKGQDARSAVAIAGALGLRCDRRLADPAYLASPASLAGFYVLDGMVPTWSVLIGALYPELDNRLGVVWDGLALDVALGGSHADSASTDANLAHFLAHRRANRLMLRVILRPHVFDAMDAGFMDRIEAQLGQIPPSPNQFTHFLLQQRTRRRIAVNPYQLYAAQAEPMTPAADRDFMDYVLGIPSELRRGHRLYRAMLRQEFPFLTRAPIVSGGKLIVFDGQEQPARPPQSRLARYARRVARLGLGGPGDRSGQPAFRNLVVRVLEQQHFDRPIYNRGVLRQLFAAYRSGQRQYHSLFELVFYIELWHLLFAEPTSDLFLNPQQSDLLGESSAARALA